MSKLQTFKNIQFGEIRVVEKKWTTLVCGCGHMQGAGFK